MSETPRGTFKRLLARLPQPGEAQGASLLIFHRVGGGTTNELDLEPDVFARQIELLAEHDVLSLDTAIQRLNVADRSPSIVLTFDDGFADVYEHAWPLLRARRMPFTIYLATAYMGTTMRWEGATAKGPSGQGLSWDQLRELVDSGLCTIGNHTHRHVRPEHLTSDELDECTATIETQLGVTPRHFTYPWGIPVPAMEGSIRARFLTASTGELGRNEPGHDPFHLRRIPVRRTDPHEFFAAKLSGNLLPERTYAGAVKAAKALLGLRRSAHATDS